MDSLLLAASHHATAHAGSGGATVPIVLLVIGLVIGLHWGRRRGLRHLGESEFRTRWARVREIRRF